MKKTKFRGLRDDQLATILQEHAAVINNHAETLRQVRTLLVEIATALGHPAFMKTETAESAAPNPGRGSLAWRLIPIELREQARKDFEGDPNDHAEVTAFAKRWLDVHTAVTEAAGVVAATTPEDNVQ
jgi:hypothetical protein